jgi:alpha-glucosidase
MQWDGSANAGFTDGRPWLPLDPAYETRNVEAQSKDPASMLTLCRRLLALRKQHQALSLGDYVPVRADANLFAYERVHPGERLLVALNLGPEPLSFALPGDSAARVLLSTYVDREEEVGPNVQLRPNEGVVLRASTPPS